MSHFNWTRDVSYNDAAKRAFHSTGMRRLRKLATELGLPKGSYDIRSTKAGPALSGEISLHHETVYVKVSQWLGFAELGILIRKCRGREDYTGGRNFYQPLCRLNDIPLLAKQVRFVMKQSL